MRDVTVNTRLLNHYNWIRGQMTAEQLRDAVADYLKDGGEITKLPNGPKIYHQKYTAYVPTDWQSKGVVLMDVTALENPANRAQHKYFVAHAPRARGDDTSHCNGERHGHRDVFGVEVLLSGAMPRRKYRKYKMI